MTDANTAEPDGSGQPGERYWQHAAAGEFVLPTCADCGHRFLPPQGGCPRCAGERIDLTPSTGPGTLYSFSVVPGKDADTVIAVADLDDLDPGSRLYSRLMGAADAAVVGSRVQVSCEDIGSGARVPVLTLTEES